MNFYEGDLSCLAANKHAGKIVDSLVILGRIPKTKDILVVSCNICKQDTELFGAGLFTTRWAVLERNQKPCGCGGPSDWEDWQKEIRINRKLVGSEQSLISVEGSRCLLKCAIHGLLESKDIHSVLKLGGICNECANERRRMSHTKSEDSHLADFLKTEKFSVGTTFTRVEGHYWSVKCSTCQETYVAFGGNLKKGQIGCECSLHSQKYAYLNLILEDELPVCLKFGITNNPIVRLAHQKSRTRYLIESVGVWKFDTVLACKSSEREIKKSLKCGILSKMEMVDGHTETTSLLEIDKIMKIYENNGGVKCK